MNTGAAYIVFGAFVVFSIFAGWQWSKALDEQKYRKMWVLTGIYAVVYAFYVLLMWDYVF